MVEPVDSKRRMRTVHRFLIKPCICIIICDYFGEIENQVQR
jgi:hypothetical protein